MGTRADRLIKLRRQERELHNYSQSSRWYVATSQAINFLELAENATSPRERFLDAWGAVYNLFMLFGERGDPEYKRLHLWIDSLKPVPEVRRLLVDAGGGAAFSDFRQALARSANTLLGEEGRQQIAAWQRRTNDPESACTYFVTMARDIRNKCSHPNFNPSGAATKRSLTAASNCLVPFAEAAIEAMIRRPLEGTTGKTIAYRSFLWPFLNNSDSFFSDYYLEFIFADEELAELDESATRAAFHRLANQLTSLRGGLQAGDEALTAWCQPLLFPALQFNLRASAKIVTSEGVFQPTHVLPADAASVVRSEYDAGQAAAELAGLVWVLPWRTTLDAVATTVEHTGLTLIEVAHRALMASNVSWAVLTNGRHFRLLRKATAHRPRAFLEIDLQSALEQPNNADALRAFRYWLGLFSGPSFTTRDERGQTRLERVVAGSDEHGEQIGKELKENVFKALEELGEGCLAFLRSHDEVREVCRARLATDLGPRQFLGSDELLDEIYHETLSLMYRLLFLFYAESRDLLPLENETYRDTYSLQSLRDEIQVVFDDPSQKQFFSPRSYDLWQRLKELCRLVNEGWLDIIPIYNGGLFDPGQHALLETIQIDDGHLARAIDLLSRTRPGRAHERGAGRKKITYRDLDIRHLGSIYEGILEYAASIASEDLVVFRRGSASDWYEEYVAESDFSKADRKQYADWKAAIDDDPESPQLPRRCTVRGEKKKGAYYLAYGGRESKRRSSGSYYTPDYVVQFIVDNALGPVLRGECRGSISSGKPKPLSSKEILDLKVLDPAMGSGHFLVAATEYLARAYGEALISEGAADGQMTDDQFTRYKRQVAERCVYGLDINPMAVELAQVSLWLFTMDRGRPLSFLKHHLKAGNGLIGAWISQLGSEPNVASHITRQSMKAPVQGNLFEQRFRSRVPQMVRHLYDISTKETAAAADVQAKKTLDVALEELKRPYRQIADAWIGGVFGESLSDYYALLTDADYAAQPRKSECSRELSAFHWEIEFPDVWFDAHGNRQEYEGFDCVLQNPPWGARYTDAAKRFLNDRFSSVVVRIPNSFMYFLGQSAHLLCEKGSIGVIVPDTALSQPETQKLREAIKDSFDLRTVANLGLGVFTQLDGSEPTAPSCVLCMSRPKRSGSIAVLDVSDVESKSKAEAINKRTLEVVPHHDYFSLPKLRFLACNDLRKKLAIAHKAFRHRQTFGAIREDLSQGITTGGDYAFVVDAAIARNIERSVLKPTLTGTFLEAYRLLPCPLSIIYADASFDIKEHAKARTHLTAFKQRLETKVETRQGIRPWYRLHRARDAGKLSNRKVLIRQTGDRLIAALDDLGLYVLDSIYFITVKDSLTKEYELELVESLLNSTLWNFLYVLLTQESGRVFPQVKAANVDDMPVPTLAEVGEIASLLGKGARNPLDASWRDDVDRKVSSIFGLLPSEHSYMQEILKRD
jgi:type I restriction-modification system DNA methylase subunit